MSTRIIFALVNVFGGAAVLGSYAWCLANYPEHRDALWGGIQGSLRSAFTISMFLAAAGYLTFCYVNLFKGEAMAFGRDSLMGTNTVVITTFVFLASATIWMPSSIAYIRSGASAWWVLCVVSLWVTAISLCVMTGVTALSAAHIIPQTSKYAAVAGLAYITFHCLFLDAITWVKLFK